jgi:hypothetical protein
MKKIPVVNPCPESVPDPSRFPASPFFTSEGHPEGKTPPTRGPPAGRPAGH